jgi:hypothetical protein
MDASKITSFFLGNHPVELYSYFEMLEVVFDTLLCRSSMTFGGELPSVSDKMLAYRPSIGKFAVEEHVFYSRPECLLERQKRKNRNRINGR